MNRLRQCWTIIKLIYLHIGYWLVGLPEEYFYTKKGNYFLDLNWYHRAIRNYKKALQDSDDPHIHSMLGYCYSRIGTPVEAVEHYSKVHDKIRDPKIDLGLAISAFESGNIKKSEEIIDEVRRSNCRLKSQDTEALDWIEMRIELAKKGRKDLTEMEIELNESINLTRNSRVRFWTSVITRAGYANRSACIPSAERRRGLEWLFG